VCPHTAVYVSSYCYICVLGFSAQPRLRLSPLPYAYACRRRADASLLCRMLTYADVCRRRADASLLCRAGLSHPSALSRTLARARRTSLLCRWLKKKIVLILLYLCPHTAIYVCTRVHSHIFFNLKKAKYCRAAGKAIATPAAPARASFFIFS
jgi:hypothetical protein